MVPRAARRSFCLWRAIAAAAFDRLETAMPANQALRMTRRAAGQSEWTMSENCSRGQM